MTVTLELTPEEMTELTAHANARGVDVETLLHCLIASLTKAPRPAPLPTGHHAVETDDPEDQAERERETREMQNNIRRWREEQRRGADTV